MTVRRSRHTEHSSQDDRYPGHSRLIYGGHRSRAVTSRACAFGARADQEAGLINEIYDRQMERIAEVDKTSHLFAPRGVERAAAPHRIAGQHADRVTVQPRKPRDQRAPIKASDLEK